MRILIGCEESGAVRDAFAALGHDAFSCDLLPARNGGAHFQQDILELLRMTRGQWDIVILHPPCTALALCGNSTYGRGMAKHAQRLEALDWTEALWREATAHCAHVMLENPKNVLGARIGRHSQVIHPWQFGHPEQKETWLWLHGLPPLVETQNVYEEMMALPKAKRERIHYMSPSDTRARDRSVTFSGIATAIAEQWIAALALAGK